MAPTPSPEISHAVFRLRTPHGLIDVERRNTSVFTLHAHVPPGSTAAVTMPDGTLHRLGSGHHTLQAPAVEGPRPHGDLYTGGVTT
ncbi:alpha-L-rhamnosidase C-terminal domain-containing protein [Nonomuraea jabiensis]|uniref:alpha-L-rhamnosidase C-terminal domain-containing protein n=1 Tax=Nonomuraea jabiensis TaxID=882448 RepID=UPI00343A11B3